MKKILIVLFLIIIVLIIFPKTYDQEGGEYFVNFSDDKKCVGFSYDYYPSKCFDCLTNRYCFGIPVSK